MVGFSLVLHRVDQVEGDLPLCKTLDTEYTWDQQEALCQVQRLLLTLGQTSSWPAPQSHSAGQHWSELLGRELGIKIRQTRPHHPEHVALELAGLVKHSKGGIKYHHGFGILATALATSLNNSLHFRQRLSALCSFWHRNLRCQSRDSIVLQTE